MSDVQTATEPRKRRARAPSPKKPIVVTKHTIPDSKKIEVLAPENPKSFKSPSWHRFNLYFKSDMTVGRFRELMRKAGHPNYANLDLARDYARGHIRFV